MIAWAKRHSETRKLTRLPAPTEYGLPWDPKVLDFHKTQRAVLTASHWQVRQKMYSSSVGRWKHYQKFIGPLLDLRKLG